MKFSSLVGLELSTRIENGSLVTSDLEINGKYFPLIIDFNSPDLIVPIADDLYDPKSSGSFRYCSGDSACYDRQVPPFTCPRTVPSTEWSVDTSVLTRHSVTIDGAAIGLNCFEFIESIGSAQQVPMKGAVDAKVSVLGIGPRRMSCRDQTFVTSIGSKYITLSPDRISFGNELKIEPAWSDVFHTSPSNSSSLLGKYAFNIFKPTVCGVDILEDVSAQWTVVMDSTVECLVLPQFFYERIKAWKPFSDGVLYFTVDQDGAQGYVGLDLKDVCVQSRMDSADSVLTSKRPIVLGYRALQAMETLVLETSEPFRVGLIGGMKPYLDCTAQVPQCVGQQIYNRGTNTCAYPDCSAFLFSRLNPESGSCEFMSSLPYVIYITITALVLGEIAVFFLRRKAIQVAQEACERNVVDSR